MKLSTEEKKTWKQAIKAACIALLEKRLAISQLAMDQAQESANSDDKSSAGDKYETGRAMGQRDRDMLPNTTNAATNSTAFKRSIPKHLMSAWEQAQWSYAESRCFLWHWDWVL
jgi:hypothetical protein